MQQSSRSTAEYSSEEGGKKYAAVSRVGNESSIIFFPMTKNILLYEEYGERMIIFDCLFLLFDL
jgi:hypothetical protein